MNETRHIKRIVWLFAIVVFPFSAVAQFWPEAVSEPFAVDTAIWIADADGDGLPDWWEELHFGGPTNAVASAVLTSDGLTTLQKYNGGWNPFVSNPSGLPHGLSALFSLSLADIAADSDGDGLPDWWESLYFGGATNAVAGEDASGDGMTNIEAYNGGWNPRLMQNAALSTATSTNVSVNTGGWLGGYGLDTDGDGMPDWWEFKYGLSPYENDAGGDPDGDGITSIEEYRRGLVPNKDSLWGEVWAVSMLFYLDTIGMTIDTDGDGIPDWWETLYFGGATIAAPGADPDGDDRTNLQEYRGGGNPLIFDWFVEFKVAQGNIFLLNTGGRFADEDGDGIPDWWERRYTGDDVGLNADASAASGMSLRETFIAYLDPTNPNAVFAIRTLETPGAEGVTIRWDTADGRRYKLYGKASLTEGWPLLPIHEVLGDGQPKSFTAAKDAGSARFFRLTVEVLPEE